MLCRQGLVFIFVGNSQESAGAPLAFPCQRFVWRADGGLGGYKLCLLFAGAVSDECGMRGGECWGAVSAQVEWIWSKLSTNSWSSWAAAAVFRHISPMFWVISRRCLIMWMWHCWAAWNSPTDDQLAELKSLHYCHVHQRKMALAAFFLAHICGRATGRRILIAVSSVTSDRQ